MTSVNSFGLRIVFLTTIAIVVVAGCIKLITLGFSHSAIQAPSPTPQANLAPIASAAPSPQQSLSPELLAQMSNFAKDTSSKVGPVTKKYVESLPKDASASDVLNPTTMSTYVSNNQGQLLQPLPAGTVLQTSTSGKAAIKAYLDAISPTQNKKLQNVTGDAIVTAFQKQESGEDTQALAAVLSSIQSNFSLLKAIRVPKEALELHTTLLQATQALVTNIQRIQTFKDDQINGLIGLKSISDLDAVYNSISSQISVLEKKYNLQ